MKRSTALLMTFLLLCSAFFSLYGCAETVNAAENLTENVKASGTAERISTSLLAADVTDLALRLLSKDSAEGESAVISPISVLAAVGMAAAGAESETLSQIEEAVGMNRDTLASFIYTYCEGLLSSEQSKIESANSVWVSDRLTVKNEFLQKNVDYFSSEVYKLPFDTSAVDRINSWVKENTDGLIPSMLDSLDENEVMHLISAVAFDAEWASIYGDSAVKSGEFTTSLGVKKKVQMMHSTESYYLEDENATGFLKYYSGKRYALAAILPKEDLSVDEYIRTVDGAALSTLLCTDAGGPVDAVMPKFTADYDSEMSDTLKAMGITDAFDRERADFSSICDTEDGNVHFSRVLHKVTVKVDKAGTKAAAATDIGLTDESNLPFDDPQKKEVRLDRPFVYAIIDTQVKIPIFIGKVCDLEGDVLPTEAESDDKTDNYISSPLRSDRKAEAVCDFTARLLSSLFDGENVLVSPVSILGALGLAMNGAEGDTLAQLEAAIGVTAEELPSLIGAASDGDTVRNAASVWYRLTDSFTLNDAFTDSCAEDYSAEVFERAFDPSTVADINGWVKENTDGMIDGIIDEISTSDLLYLISTTLFDAEWMSPYYEEQLKDSVFTTENGEMRDVILMCSDENEYLENENSTGFVKYYNGGRYAFAALLPDEGITLEEYLGSLSGELLLAMLENPTYYDVYARIPKLSLGYETDLSPVLSAMGVKYAFSPSLADFSSIAETDSDALYLSKVLHRTVIELGELGTKAGAVTAIPAPESAMPGEERFVYLNRPFVYMIIDTETLIPIFAGCVTDVGE